MDLHITHDRFGSSSDTSINGHLHYPNDIDKSLHEVASDKIRKYRSDCNNNPPSPVSFTPPITNLDVKTDLLTGLLVGKQDWK
jgi:hypothetical protein